MTKELTSDELILEHGDSQKQPVKGSDNVLAQGKASPDQLDERASGQEEISPDKDSLIRTETEGNPLRSAQVKKDKKLNNKPKQLTTEEIKQISEEQRKLEKFDLKFADEESIFDHMINRHLDDSWMGVSDSSLAIVRKKNAPSAAAATQFTTADLPADMILRLKNRINARILETGEMITKDIDIDIGLLINSYRKDPHYVEYAASPILKKTTGDAIVRELLPNLQAADYIAKGWSAIINRTSNSGLYCAIGFFTGVAARLNIMRKFVQDKHKSSFIVNLTGSGRTPRKQGEIILQEYVVNTSNIIDGNLPTYEWYPDHSYQEQLEEAGYTYKDPSSLSSLRVKADSFIYVFNPAVRADVQCAALWLLSWFVQYYQLRTKLFLTGVPAENYPVGKFTDELYYAAVEYMYTMAANLSSLPASVAKFYITTGVNCILRPHSIYSEGGLLRKSIFSVPTDGLRGLCLYSVQASPLAVIAPPRDYVSAVSCASAFGGVILTTCLALQSALSEGGPIIVHKYEKGERGRCLDDALDGLMDLRLLSYTNDAKFSFEEATRGRRSEKAFQDKLLSELHRVYGDESEIVYNVILRLLDRAYVNIEFFKVSNSTKKLKYNNAFCNRFHDPEIAHLMGLEGNGIMQLEGRHKSTVKDDLAKLVKGTDLRNLPVLLAVSESKYLNLSFKAEKKTSYVMKMDGTYMHLKPKRLYTLSDVGWKQRGTLHKPYSLAIPQMHKVKFKMNTAFDDDYTVQYMTQGWVREVHLNHFRVAPASSGKVNKDRTQQ